ncbi:MAG: tyrosine-type recombinase/integrase [Selenomonadaceae bacterium]|nr:tyrosine-type recombinase/integrase [Selenomonadaceae bacterium]
MTTAMVKIENREVTTNAGIFGEDMVARFVKFAGVSESSAKTYTKCLRQMFKYFKANEITMPTRENLVDWINAMRPAGDVDGKKETCEIRLDHNCVIRYTGDVSDDGRQYLIREDVLYLTTGKNIVVESEAKSNSTVQLYVSSVKIFFRWLSQEGLFANIADHLKTGVKPAHGHKKDALDVDQCRNLVANVKGDSVKDLRDKAILTLMTTAGVRTIEVVRANVADIRFERGKVFLYVTGKGHTEADDKVLLSKQAHAAIREYLKARGRVQSSDPLFVSTSRRNKNARLETQTVSRLVKRNLREIGLDSPRLTAHSLRHAVATNLIFAGVELPKVQMTLRHRSLSTTMIYAAAWERYTNDSEQILADMIFKTSKE